MGTSLYYVELHSNNNIIILICFSLYSCVHVHAGMTTTVMLQTALISITCVLVVMSLFIFIAGVICGHYISHRWRESADRNKQSKSHNTVTDRDLELKENVAYITLYPTA